MACILFNQEFIPFFVYIIIYIFNIHIYNAKNFFENKNIFLTHSMKSLNSYQPLISIITVTYNAESTIEETIKSVINQTYPNIEYLIIDGASTDSTTYLAKKYSNKISEFLSEPDSGIYDAMNKGIRLSKGDAVVLLNAGDQIHSCLIEEMVNFSNGNIENLIIASDWLVVNKEGISLKYRKANFQFKSRMGASHTGVLVGRNIYNKYGLYDINYKFVADYDFFVKVWKHSAKSFIRIPLPWVHYLSEGTTTNNLSLALKDRLSAINKHFRFHEALIIKFKTYLRIFLLLIKIT